MEKDSDDVSASSESFFFRQKPATGKEVKHEKGTKGVRDRASAEVPDIRYRTVSLHPD